MHEKTTDAPTRSEIALKLHPDDPKDKTGKKGSSARSVGILILIAVLAGGFFVWRSTHKPQTTAAAGRGRGDRGGDPNARVPVSVTAAQKRDLPVYLDGLGSVEAFNTVTVKSRVDGQIMQVFFKEGQEVRKGDLLANIDSRPFEVALAQAQATLAKDQAQLADAKAIAQRDGQLLKDGIIPQQQYDTQVALTNQLQAATSGDQAQIDSAKLNIDYSHITAPIEGRIGLRLVDPGNIVHASDANGLLVITEVEPISVIFTISEDQVPAVASAMHAGRKLQVEAYDREMKNKLSQGTLATLDNQIDQTTGTVRLRAIFNNKDGVLFPNQFVNARMLVQEKKGVTLVPTAAVQRNSQMTYVYLVKPDQSVTVRAVAVGTTEGANTEVVSGLAPGDVLVTSGVDKLQDGTKVTVHFPGEGGQKAGQ